MLNFGIKLNKKILMIALFAAILEAGFAKEIILGGKEGWPVFQSEKNITKGKGRYGRECVQLETNSFVTDKDTDLLVNFENESNPIASGNYSIVENNLKLSNQTSNQKLAGLSRNMGGLRIRGNEGTFFGTEGLKGSFSIEFWLCPSISENGEVILNWESSKEINGNLIFQHLNAIFNKGHLEWTISNLFDFFNSDKEDADIIMKGSTNIIPDTWSYHALSYDCETGLLEYVVNGITEDIRYVTSTGTEDGEISLVFLGTPSELQFCTEYTGKIDGIRILKRAYSQPDFQSADNAGKLSPVQYLPSGGRFVTKPIMVSNGSTLNSISAEMSVPSKTAVCYYVRSGDNFYGWTDSYPEWKPVEADEQLTGITGLYFQLAVELFPDGDGAVTPSITQITMNYTELADPLPPFVVKAAAGNGSVTVSWNYSVDDNAGGYYLYYGTRSGEYLGRIALEGESPINVGNITSFTVTGLENGTIYYFAVAAWSVYDNRVIGNLSKEVFARPLARLKK